MVKALAQGSVIDLTDGFGVFLSNDSTIFKKNPAGTFLKATEDTTVSAFQGNKATPVTVNTANITKPTGVTVTSDSNPNTPKLTITVAAAAPVNGVVIIPVTLGSGEEAIIINKYFSFSIVQDGVGKSTTAIAYAKSTSGTTEPTGESDWKTTIALVGTLLPGEFLWTRTVTSFNNNTSTTAYTVSLQGQTGNGIKSSVTTYQVSTSGTTPPPASPPANWKDTPQATTVTNKYLWTRTIVTYDNDVTNTQYAVSVHGATGAPGEDAWTMDIESNGSTIFRNNTGTVTLTARIYQGAVEVTTPATLATIKWFKNGVEWTGKTGKTCVVTAADIDNAAVIKAELP